MLSATNHAVVHSSDQETLLATFDALITPGAFPMMFIALTETGGFPLRMHRTHGIAAERLPLLTQALQDPQNPVYQLMAGLKINPPAIHPRQHPLTPPTPGWSF